MAKKKSRKNPSPDEHHVLADDALAEARNSLKTAEAMERAGARREAHNTYRSAYGWTVRAGTERSHTAGRPQRRVSAGAIEKVAQEAAEGINRTCGPKGNPNTTEHRANADKLIRKAENALQTAVSAEERGRPWQEEFDSYLTALVWAMMAHQEAEHGAPQKSRKRGARRMARSVRSTEEYAIHIAQSSLEALRKMVVMAKHQGRGEGVLAVANPANIPGGNMTECIAIMEARGDVESPGALCNWMAQKAGERRGNGAGSRTGGTSKARAILRRAMRGT